MSNPEFIFVTLSLVILVAAAYWMRIPRAAIPLGIVYLIFIMFNPYNPTTSEKMNIIHKPVSGLDQNIPEQTPLGSKPIQPIGTTVKPKLLTFDSGRTQKDLPVQEETVPGIKAKPKPTIEKATEKEESETLLHLQDIQICKKVVNRNPIDPDVLFNKGIDTLYCYTRIQNPGKKQEVQHNWYFEDKLMTKIRYNVKKSNIYRSWTIKRIYPTQVGQWRVDVQDSYGNIIGSKKFEIKDSSIDS